MLSQPMDSSVNGLSVLGFITEKLDYCRSIVRCPTRQTGCNRRRSHGLNRRNQQFALAESLEDRTLLAAEISGSNWRDVDGNGTRDAGDPGLANWSIFIDTNENGRYDANEPLETTNANGDYTFTGLSAGTYKVGEVRQSGWAQTLPAPPVGSGVELFSQVTLGSIPGENSAANDVWGYVSPSGREYAIIGLNKGTGYIEVTDPASPVVVAFIPGPDEHHHGSGHSESSCHDDCGGASTWRDIKVYGQYAYITNETSGGLQIVDLQQIDTGTVTDVGSFTDGGLQTAHNISINTATGIAYLTGANIANGGLVAIDVGTDPLNPSIVGTWSVRYLHDAEVYSYTSGPMAGHEIAYGFGEGGGVYVIDATDKNNMVTMAVETYPNVTYSHYGALSADQKYLFVNDELDELQNANVETTTTYVLDVQDPANPQYLTSFTNGLESIDHNLRVIDNFLFEVNYTSGLRVFNVSNVMDIVETGFYDTYPANDQASFVGAWGIFADLPSRAILVSDTVGGLFVLDAAVATDPFRGFQTVELAEDEVKTGVDFGNRLLPSTADLSVTTQGDETGPTNIELTVKLSRPNATESSISFDVDDLMTGTATSGDDYIPVAADAQIQVLPGDTTGTLSIAVTDDAVAEPLETVISQISNPSDVAVTIGAGNASAEITDNDVTIDIEIIDNVDGGGDGFNVQGPWGYLSKPGRGRDNDFHYILAGVGNNVATWTFDINPGTHQVAATWSALHNRASNAKYTIFDGSNLVGVFEVDQRSVPGDFTDDGSPWQELHTHTFVNTQIVVQLSDDADQQVIADAIRIESAFTTSGVVVTQPNGSTDVAEGGSQDTYTIALNMTPTSPVEITATADAETEISLDGSNFSTSVVFTATDTSGQTITVRAVDDSDAEGEHTGVISHEITDSSDPAYPTTLSVRPVSVNITDNDASADIEIIDNVDGGGDGFNVQGPWGYLSKPGRGRDNDFHYILAGVGNNVATWTFDINPGTHQVAATWSALHNRASNAKYTIFDGSNLVGVFEVDQRSVPGDFTDDGSPWQELHTHTFVNTQIVVQLSDDADQQVIADAIRIESAFTTSGVVVTQPNGSTDVAEGGSQDTYTIALNMTPTSPVEITATADAETEISLDGSNFSTSVVFTATDTSGQTITVRAVDDSDAEGEHTGVISHEITDSSDPAYPTTLSVRPVSVNITDNDASADIEIIDNVDGGGDGFNVQGPWGYLSKPGRGRDNDFHYILAGVGNNVATWTFDINPGTHQVAATWSALYNRASNAKYTIFDGSDLVGVFEVDQRFVPGDFTDDGSPWQELHTHTFVNTQIVVQLSDDADQQVIADAIRIEGIAAPSGIIAGRPKQFDRDVVLRSPFPADHGRYLDKLFEDHSAVDYLH